MSLSPRSVVHTTLRPVTTRPGPLQGAQAAIIPLDSEVHVSVEVGHLVLKARKAVHIQQMLGAVQESSSGSGATR